MNFGRSTPIQECPTRPNKLGIYSPFCVFGVCMGFGPFGQCPTYISYCYLNNFY